MRNLNEDKRQQLIAKSKSSAKGNQRFKRRVKSKVAKNVKSFNSINMNKLFKQNILDVGVQVHGETADYVVTISFGGFLDILQKNIRINNDHLDLRIVIRSLMEAFNSDDVYIKCSCLHPDTKIKLLDGTTLPVAEMKTLFDQGEKLFVYSVDSNGDFKPGEVEKVWITDTVDNFIKIILDNDEEIITTPDHLYMLRDGSYCQAQNLVEGQSLMPLYFNERNGYETVKFNSTGKYHSTYKIVAESLKQEKILEAKQRVKSDDNMRYDVAIHHKDFNKSNNHPDNLEVMTAREHWNYHASTVDRLWEDEEFRRKTSERSSKHMKALNANPTEKMLESRKAWHEKGRLRNYDEDRKKLQSKIAKENLVVYNKNLSKEQREEISKKLSEASKNAWDRGCFDTEKFKKAALERSKLLHSPEVQHLATAGVQKYWENISEDEYKKRKEISIENLSKTWDRIRGSKFSEEHKKKISQAHLNKTPEEKAEKTRKTELRKIENQLLKLIECKKELTEENYKKISYAGCPRITKYFKTLDEAVKFFNLNHKVKSIEYISIPGTPVYDIKVKEYQNFLVDAGVILHNCPDWRFRFAYYANINDITVDPKENRPSKITNPHDTLGSACKHVLLVLSNNSWLVKVASVINNYIKYMEQHMEHLYAEIIFPAIYGREYDVEYQLSLDGSDELDSTEDTIDASNEEGRKRGQFKQGNQYRFKPYKDKEELEGQTSLEDEEIDNKE